MNKISQAEIRHLRQETQFTCCAASIASALAAHGKSVRENDVNKVLGAAPMAGATWEAMLATVQYFGLRGHLVVPATVRMLKEWTDQGIPVVIAWNPEDRPWSHASTVFHVEDNLTVHIMDPNIPNPDETVRVLSAHDFCKKWSEKVSESLLVRRPAMAIMREITPEGRQVMASLEARKKLAQTPEEEDALRSLGWTDRQIENMSEKRIDLVLQKKIKSRGRQAKVDEKLMTRAALLLIYKGEKEAAKILMNDGISAEDAYLAVKAGAIMNLQPNNLINKVVQRYANRVAHEVYVDKNGYGHDDEGNTWYVGKEYGEGTYGLHDLPRNTYEEPSTSDRPQHRRPGRAPQAPTRVNKEQLAAVDALVLARPRDRFILSLREQVASGRVLSDKQKKALRQNFYRNGMKDKADLFR